MTIEFKELDGPAIREVLAGNMTINGVNILKVMQSFARSCDAGADKKGYDAELTPEGRIAFLQLFQAIARDYNFSNYADDFISPSKPEEPRPKYLPCLNPDVTKWTPEQHQWFADLATRWGEAMQKEFPGIIAAPAPEPVVEPHSGLTGLTAALKGAFGPNVRIKVNPIKKTRKRGS